MDDPELKRHMSAQEIRVGELLLQDFEKSGIHMPKARKETFITLNDKIRELGQEFIHHAYPSAQSILIDNPDKELEGLPAHIVQALQGRSGRGGLNLPTSSPITHAILRDGRHEGTRRKAFLALNSGNENQISVLEGMLKCRSSLAQLLGRKNYAELYLSDKMAGTPGTALCI
jgi:intermediate peptidase